MPTLRNPKLPPDQVVTVDEPAVIHYLRSGWEVIPDYVPPVVEKRVRPFVPEPEPAPEPERTASKGKAKKPDPDPEPVTEDPATPAE